MTKKKKSAGCRAQKVNMELEGNGELEVSVNLMSNRNQLDLLRVKFLSKTRPFIATARSTQHTSVIAKTRYVFI